MLRAFDGFRLLCAVREGPWGAAGLNRAVETALRGAGLVVTAENPADGRRLLYRLSPTIPARRTETGWELDFGYCLVRC